MFKLIIVTLLFLQAQALQEANDPTDEITKQLDRYTSILHDYREVIAAIDELKNSTELKGRFCDVCERVADCVLNYRRRKADKDGMVALLQYVCVQFTENDEEACWGHAHINIDVVLYIVDNKKNLTGKRICAILYQFENCKDPDMEKWSVEIPPRTYGEPKGLENGTAGKVPLRILHLTDIHYDPNYLPGSNANCYEKEICCERESTMKPNGSYVPAGYWGDYHNCDIPWHSIENAFNEIRNRNLSTDLVYYTGDIISHRTWTTNIASNSFDLKVVFAGLHETFGSIPVYPVLGNHEAHPVNYYSPEFLANASYSIQWLYDLSNEEWSRWLPEDTKDTIRKGGYYTTLIKPRLRLIALNTNVCYISNLWLIYDDTDPYGQLQWLVGVLLEAERNGEYVHIISHVPNWQPECHVTWSHEYRRVVDRFAHIISAQFNGHTHQDQFQLFYNMSSSHQVINVAYNGGSLTTYVANNPNYRIYDVSPEDYSVLDYDEFIYNLTEANLTPDKPPRWYKLYSFKEAYGLDSMSYEALGKLVERMVTDISTMQKYYRYYVRESDALMALGCDRACLADKFCEIISSEASVALQCAQQKKMFFSQHPSLVQRIGN